MHFQPRHVRNVIALVAAFALTAAAGAYAAGELRDSEDKQPVRQRQLAQKPSPAGARGWTLGLSRVKIAPGAKLALHRHPGTQIATIERGTLSYWVIRGSVRVRRGDPSGRRGARLVRTIRAGQHGRIRSGDWIVERPGTIHRAANRGRRPISITLATLLRKGAPAAIPVRRAGSRREQGG